MKALRHLYKNIQILLQVFEEVSLSNFNLE